MNAPPRNTQTRVSVIELDSVELAVPQTNLHTVESVLDFKNANDGRAAAYIKLHGEQWPVYCPNDNLEVVQLKAERRICAMLIVGNGLFGLVCREVSNIEVDELRTFELPVCMRTPDTPLRGLGLVGARVVCLTSAQSLYTMFTAQYANRDACVISSLRSDLDDPLARARGVLA